MVIAFSWHKWWSYILKLTEIKESKRRPELKIPAFLLFKGIENLACVGRKDLPEFRYAPMITEVAICNTVARDHCVAAPEIIKETCIIDWYEVFITRCDALSSD